MNHVLGLELSEAVSLLTGMGYTVEAEEVRSRKGQQGNEKRVVRQLERNGVICLTYAEFQTVINDNREGPVT